MTAAQSSDLTSSLVHSGYDCADDKVSRRAVQMKEKYIVDGDEELRVWQVLALNRMGRSNR
jgi:hypothetical protein